MKIKDVKIIKIDNCWFPANLKFNKDGYSRMGRDSAHRMFYREFNGEITMDVVRHLCNNRWCLNPEHLKQGTHNDNVQDRVKSNRSAVGENNGRSKLKKEEVIEIFNDNDTPKAHLAKKFGVDPAVIRRIKNGTKWTCVTKELI